MDREQWQKDALDTEIWRLATLIVSKESAESKRAHRIVVENLSENATELTSRLLNSHKAQTEYIESILDAQVKRIRFEINPKRSITNEKPEPDNLFDYGSQVISDVGHAIWNMAGEFSSRLLKGWPYSFLASYQWNSEEFTPMLNGVNLANMPVEDILMQLQALSRQARFFWHTFRTLPCLSLGDSNWPLCSSSAFFSGNAHFGMPEQLELFQANDPYLRFGHEAPDDQPLDAETRAILSVSLHRFLTKSDKTVMVTFSDGHFFMQSELQKFIAYRIREFLKADRPTGLLKWLLARAFGRWSDREERALRREGTTLPAATMDWSGRFAVEVTCKSPGLRIYSSPAYFVDWLYFGHPSPTVKNLLLPGRYIFATDGDDERDYLPDPAVFSIPSDCSPSIKKF